MLVENKIVKDFICPLSKQVEKYNLPQAEVEKFDYFVKDIKTFESEGLWLMYTLIDFSDAFSKYRIKHGN
jgi:hypothetical protein